MQLLKDRAAGKVTESAAEIKPLSAANVKILNGLGSGETGDGGKPVLQCTGQGGCVGRRAGRLTAYRMNGDVQRKEGTTIEFEAAAPVSLLVGYFRDDQKKYAKAPKLETDASANDYGQAEPN